jgi:hypothetical protein
MKNPPRFAKVEKVKPGDWLQADGRFDCIEEGSQREVLQDVNKDLFIICKEGKHFLDAQISACGRFYGGLSKCKTKKDPA